MTPRRLDELAAEACACGQRRCPTVRRVRDLLARELVAAWADGLVVGLRLALHFAEKERAALPPFGGPIAGLRAAIDRVVARLRRLIP